MPKRSEEREAVEKRKLAPDIGRDVPRSGGVVVCAKAPKRQPYAPYRVERAKLSFLLSPVLGKGTGGQREHLRGITQEGATMELIWMLQQWSRSRQVKKALAPGFRVRMWKWQRGQCICQDEEIYMVVVNPELLEGK